MNSQSDYMSILDIIPQVNPLMLNDNFLNDLKLFIINHYVESNYDKYHLFPTIMSEMFTDVDIDLNKINEKSIFDSESYINLNPMHQDILKKITKIFEQTKNVFIEIATSNFIEFSSWNSKPEKQYNFCLLLCVLYYSIDRGLLGRCIDEVETVCREMLFEHTCDMLNISLF